MLENRINNSVLRLVKDDLTAMEIEAFVFYARPDLQLGSGFGNAIAVRGGTSIQEELKEFGTLSTGEAIVTGAGELKADYIVHAVGPRFQEEDTNGKLRTTLKNSLKAAEEKGIRKIAFPPMGRGFYGIPLGTCADVMIDEIEKYLSGGTSLEEVVVCVSDRTEMEAFEKKMKIVA